MRASNYTTVLSLALAFLLLASSLAQDTTAAPQDTTTAALLDTTQSPASQDSTTQAPQDGSAEGTPKPKGLVIVTTALLTGNNQGQQGQGWQGQGSNQGSGQSSSSSSSSSSSGQWNQGSQSSGSQNSQGSQSTSSQGSQGSSSQGYQSSQSSQDRGDGVLSSNPDIPFPPPNCRNRAQSLQYTNGYQAAWRVILRAWDQSEGCNKFDSFQSMIKSATPNGGSCYARGYTQAIDDAVATTSRTCKSDCADIGDITGSSGASIFCGVTAPEFRTFGASKCTRIGIQTCQTAFRSTVQSKCPEQLDTFQYQSEIRKVCSPSGLGQ